MEDKNSKDDLKCEFCSKIFSTHYNLKKHVATAKICISKRPKLEKDIPNTKFECEFCKKSFTAKHNLDFHFTVCKQRKEWVVENEKEEIIEKYDKTIEKITTELEQEKDITLELEMRLEKANERIKELELSQAKNEGKIEVLEKTRTRVKNITNNYLHPKLANIPTEGLPYLTQEYIENLVDGYTYQHFRRGPAGIAQFLKECVVLPPIEGTESCEDGPLRIMFPCTDAARHKYYKHEETGWKLDVGAPFLNKAFDALEYTVREHHKTMDDEWLNELDSSYKKDLEKRRFDVLLPMIDGIKFKNGTKRDKLINDVRQYLKDHVSI